MKTLDTLLRESDPLREQPVLPAADAQAIRRAMLRAARSTVVPMWPQTLSVAAVVLLMIAAGAAAGRRLGQDGRTALVQPLAGNAVGERRQVQFATPGGTRIIWTIDPEFQLGAMP